jgi:hypothetical protein
MTSLAKVRREWLLRVLWLDCGVAMLALSDSCPEADGPLSTTYGHSCAASEVRKLQGYRRQSGQIDCRTGQRTRTEPTSRCALKFSPLAVVLVRLR